MPKNVQTTTKLCSFSNARKIMLKILQASRQQYVNEKLPDAKSGFIKGRGTRDQIANINWIIEKAREFQKTSTSASLTTLKPLTVWITTNWKTLKEMGIPDYLTCLLWNLYAGQEAIARTGYGTTNWFQIGKGVCQDCILSPCLFNFYAEFIMLNARLESILMGKISMSSDMQMTPLLWWKVKRN